MYRKRIVNSIKKALNFPEFRISTFLYGSEARGEARKDSDIELLILVDKDNVTFEDEMLISDPLYKIELETGVLINALIIPEREWGKMVTPFYENVMLEGIAL